VPGAGAVEERTSGNGADPTAGYADEHRPLGGYAALTTTLVTLATGSLVAARLAGRELPDRYGLWDVVTTGVATHKLSRLISKDKVTSFVRGPFTRYRERAGRGELSEEPRGEGLRYAAGELLVCPYCLGQWIATGFAVGMVTAPRFTRMAAYVLTAVTISDFLQLGYRAAEQRSAAG
jgi:hypothetical protein